MVCKNTHKIKILVFLTTASSISLLVNPIALADNQNVNINAKIGEVLSVSLTTPDTWASGNTNDFMRNKISLGIFSNNGNGFTASMTTKTTNSALVNQSATPFTIPTLPQNYTRSNFPADYWGWSQDDTDAGNANSTYKKISASNETPSIIFYSGAAASTTQNVYFGMKASASKAAGVYANTVIFSVVSGVIPPSDISPVDPVIADDTQITPTYDPTKNRTVYNNTTQGSGTTTTTTEISEGDSRDSYSPPQGVTTIASFNDGTALTTGIAIVAAIAAATGIFFLIAAKRRKDDDDEEKKKKK